MLTSFCLATVQTDDYKPANIQALNNWTDKNPLGLNEILLNMKAYAPYHHLYAISLIFAIGNNKSDRALHQVQHGMLQKVMV